MREFLLQSLGLGCRFLRLLLRQLSGCDIESNAAHLQWLVGCIEFDACSSCYPPDLAVRKHPAVDIFKGSVSSDRVRDGLRYAVAVVRVDCAHKAAEIRSAVVGH